MHSESSSGPIFDYLYKHISTLQIAPGEKLSENRLANQFSTSRTPVREAIARLVSIGLVEVKLKSGTFVTRLSTEKIAEAQFIREAIECAIVQKVAADSPRNTIAFCEAILKQQQQAAVDNHFELFRQLDDQFHQALADYTQFRRAAHIIQLEKAHLDRLRHVSLKEIGSQYARVLDQHHRILAAIKAGNSEVAAQIMREHTREILSVLDEIKANHADYFVQP